MRLNNKEYIILYHNIMFYNMNHLDNDDQNNTIDLIFFKKYY